ncbi:MAG TPA: hypothetical protein VFQ12_07270 [Thermoleophilaceae bacterium]|nr:hypothetical protein [Thermoleophilaceae bacterium]
MITARLVLPVCFVLTALVLAAAAWAVPDGSGGARALPVTPSAGGGSEAAPENALPAEPVVTVPEGPVIPPPMTSEIPSPVPDADLLLPGDEPVPSGGTPASEGYSQGGGFGLLADTAFGVAALVAEGVGLVARLGR